MEELMRIVAVHEERLQLKPECLDRSEVETQTPDNIQPSEAHRYKGSYRLRPNQNPVDASTQTQ